MTDREAHGARDDARETLARAASFARRTLRFWRLIVGFLVVGGAACAAFLLLGNQTFRSEMMVLYSEGVRVTDEAERPDSARSVGLRLKEILMSRAALDGLVRKFDLYPKVSRTLGPIDAVEELRKHVEFRAPGGYTFSIAFSGSSPDEAQRVTRSLGELLISEDADLRRTQALVTRDFLEAEKAATESGLRRREQELASFMAEHPRFAFDATPLSTGAAIRASHDEPKVTPPPRTAPRSAPRAARRKAAPAAAPVPPARAREAQVAADEVARASAGAATARTKLAHLRTRFTAAHPDVRAAAAELERATGRLKAATASARAAAERLAVETEVAQGREAPAAAAPAPVWRRAPAAPRVVAPVVATDKPDVVALETTWMKLTRGVTEARQHEDEVEAALFRANMAVSSEAGGGGAQVVVIDPAFLPRSPVPPGRTTIVGMFIAAALFLGFGAAVVRAVVDDRIRDAGDLSGVLTVLAEIPRAPSGRSHVHI